MAFKPCSRVAKFDGTDYQLIGSPIADGMAYALISSHSIYGTGTVSPDVSTLTQIYSIQNRASPLLRRTTVLDQSFLVHL